MFQAVQKSRRRVQRGENPGTVAEEDHSAWYREMFAPSVTADLLRAADLAGYRNTPVYIRRSMHVPPNSEAVRDAMPVFFRNADPGGRAVSAGCARPFHLRLCSSLYGWQWPYRPVSHERDRSRPAVTPGQWCRWNGGTPTWQPSKRQACGRISCHSPISLRSLLRKGSAASRWPKCRKVEPLTDARRRANHRLYRRRPP